MKIYSQWFYDLVCNFFTAKHYRSRWRSRWENLDCFQYRFQPIKFVNLVVPSPCETEPFNNVLPSLKKVLLYFWVSLGVYDIIDNDIPPYSAGNNADCFMWEPSLCLEKYTCMHVQFKSSVTFTEWRLETTDFRPYTAHM